MTTGMRRKRRGVWRGPLAGPCCLWLCLLGAGCRAELPDAAYLEEQRMKMVEIDIKGRGIRHEAVLAAMQRVPRHEFVPARLQAEAYADCPLPIGRGQTISQPYIVALMTELADPHAGSTVLEVGTGSGYQAAILADIGATVYSIEIVPELATAAAERLGRLGYTNVTVKAGDGYEGWPEVAPFDAILVTAAPEEIPQPLIDQLKPGGRMVIPVGEEHGIQELMLIQRTRDGTLAERNIIPVRFVPLTGPHTRVPPP